MYESETELTSTYAAIIGKLSIERCQSYLAHIHALIHLCETEHDRNQDHLVNRNLVTLLGKMESELTQSAEILSFFE